MFVVFAALSAVLATAGFLLNSTIVIVGAWWSPLHRLLAVGERRSRER